MSKRVPIRATAQMKQLMGFYYMMAKAAENDPEQKIAWITSGGPVEILHAAGVIPIYPENVAAMSGTMRIADEICAVAEENGFSRDLCSYARTDIGSVLSGKGPLMGTPVQNLIFLSVVIISAEQLQSGMKSCSGCLMCHLFLLMLLSNMG
jgi:benzoyl-CoA reductase/2-hydroxyglutaryl-CoA dehydratase subunit BcrC/BadD/HgdB